MFEQLSRELYRLADLPPLGDPDLVSVSLRIPRGVICLISALAYHDLTTQIPHEVYLVLEQGTERTRLKHPPVLLFWFSPRMFHVGIESREIDRTPVRVYSIEKTLADCFKYRNKIGLDIALEALQEYQKRRRVNVDRLLKAARLCRVEAVMCAYLEVLI